MDLLNLTTLQLDGNDIGDKPVYPIANGLQNNKTLRKLSLRYNEIGPKGAFRVAAVLRNNTTLINPDLFGNHIEDKGMKYFAEALKNNMVSHIYDHRSSYQNVNLTDTDYIRVWGG
ncbi:unnamed protein product, partial [Rotaria magnacalcarata]